MSKMKCKICGIRSAVTGDQHDWFCLPCYRKAKIKIIDLFGKRKVKVNDRIIAQSMKVKKYNGDYWIEDDSQPGVKNSYWLKADDWKTKEEKILNSVWEDKYDKEFKINDVSVKPIKKILTNCIKCGSVDFYKIRIRKVIECQVCKRRYRISSWRFYKTLNIEELKVRISKPGPPLPTLQRMLRPIG